MANITDLSLTDFTAGDIADVSDVNGNFDDIETKINNMLDRLNTFSAANTLVGNLSADSNKITDLALCTNDNDAARKAYVDSELSSALPDEDAFGTRTSTDTDTDTIEDDVSYQVSSDGFIMATCRSYSYIRGYIYISGNWVKVQENYAYQDASANGASIFMALKKNDYFQITVWTSDGLRQVYWQPIGSGTVTKATP